eukprot:jgi/Mesvir1/16251/Mv08500-RA.2
MLGDLRIQGYNIVEDYAAADVIIINTCAFVEDAKRESIDAILDAARYKSSNRGATSAGGVARGLFVTGCLAQRYAAELAAELPEIDAVVGFESYGQIANEIGRVLSAPKPPTGEDAQGPDTSGKKGAKGFGEASGGKNKKRAAAVAAAVAAPKESSARVLVGSPDVPFRSETERVRLTPRHVAYLRVAEGCDHSCTFCSIPSFRGKFRSKPFESVVAEARLLVASGARELCLIAEDTNQWGSDFGDSEPRRLSHLLHALAEIPSLRWIRLLYCYPSYFTDELVDAVASIDKVVKYIDMPLQHAAPTVLARMQRPGRPHTEALLAKLRERIPGLVLRTTFISGFPGESSSEHQELVAFAQKWGFERGGVFAYSEEDGTPAGAMPNQVAPRLRQERRSEMVRVFQEVQEGWSDDQVGKVMHVMVDRMDGDVAVCRTYADAPDIDNCVLIPGAIVPFTPGAVMPVKITGIDGLDLVAEVVME